MREHKQIAGLVLLNGGVVLISVYGLLVVAASLVNETHPLGRLRGIVYITGLIVVPLALILLVAGGTALLSRSARKPKHPDRVD